MTTESELIRRYSGAFTEQECDEYVNYINILENNSFLEQDDRSVQHVDHKSIRSSYSFDLPSVSYLSEKIIPKFHPCVNEYLNTFILQGKFSVYDLKIKKIPIGGGFHSWHYENGNVVNCLRQFVIQLYLNDNFDAGETEFLHQHRREIPKKGDVLIFPAGYTHTHRGNPPIGGEKYLITSWGVVQDGGN